MFGKEEVSMLIAACLTYGVTRNAGQSELTYGYEDLKAAAELLKLDDFPSAKILFGIMREMGFRNTTSGSAVRMAAPMLTVFSIVQGVAEEVRDVLAEAKKSEK
ncbi:hypothetical protein P3T43_001788 [Paraburkholderia sp. GAS41]|uniref:hypothetical protein n=1 Tax=Paraburkholderia sp. GAS41 TaxID=3035134 RepID=UPI003D220EC4